MTAPCTSEAESLPSSMAERLALIRSRIATSAASVGRDPASVVLVAVSKGHSAASIREAFALGIQDFGESYAQEWLTKRDTLRDLSGFRWHFVGHLQSNKVKLINDSISCLHSVDRLSLIEILERVRLRELGDSGKLSVLVELQVDPQDAGKTGASLAEAEKVCVALRASRTLQWRGFMGMGPAGKTPQELEQLYAAFVARARGLWKYFSPYSEVPPEISLGMSDDLESAVKAGSTMVRVGTALFGPRSDESQSSVKRV